MKKFIMAFLVAGLMITSVLSLSSCNKKDTNASAGMKDWVPTVYNVITPESNTRQGDPFTICYYCHDTIWKCDHELNLENGALYCATHSHVEFFYTTDDCTAPNQITHCEYNGHRCHYHILTYTPRYYHHSWHVGGGVCP